MNGKDEIDNSSATNPQQADRQSSKQVYSVESLIYVIIIVIIRLQTNNQKLEWQEQRQKEEEEEDEESEKQKSSIRVWQIIATIISL